MNIAYDKDLRISGGLWWGILKYGLCSYFSLAYASKYPGTGRFLAIMEHDAELENDYLVHFLNIDEKRHLFQDAEGTYTEWRDSVSEMTDNEFMDLFVMEVDKAYVLKLIEEDLGYDEEMYKTIEKFVHKVY